MRVPFIAGLVLSWTTLSFGNALRTAQLERVLQQDEDERVGCDIWPCEDMQGPCANDDDCSGELRCRRDQKCGWTVDSKGLFQVIGEDEIFRADGRGNYFFVAKRDEYIYLRHGSPVTWLVHRPHLQVKAFPYFQLAFPPLPGLLNNMDSTPENNPMPVFGLKSTVVTRNLPVLTSFQPIYGIRGHCVTSSQKEFAGIVGDGAAPLAKCRRGSVVTKLTCVADRCSKIAVECSPMLHSHDGPAGKCEVDLTAPALARYYEALKSPRPENQIICPDGYAMTLLRWNFRGRFAGIVCRKYQFAKAYSNSEEKYSTDTKK